MSVTTPHSFDGPALTAAPPGGLAPPPHWCSAPDGSIELAYAPVERRASHTHTLPDNTVVTESVVETSQTIVRTQPNLQQQQQQHQDGLVYTPPPPRIARAPSHGSSRRQSLASAAAAVAFAVETDVFGQSSRSRVSQQNQNQSYEHHYPQQQQLHHHQQAPGGSSVSYMGVSGSAPAAPRNSGVGFRGDGTPRLQAYATSSAYPSTPPPASPGRTAAARAVEQTMTTDVKLRAARTVHDTTLRSQSEVEAHERALRESGMQRLRAHDGGVYFTERPSMVFASSHPAPLLSASSPQRSPVANFGSLSLGAGSNSGTIGAADDWRPGTARRDESPRHLRSSPAASVYPTSSPTRYRHGSDVVPSPQRLMAPPPPLPQQRYPSHTQEHHYGLFPASPSYSPSIHPSSGHYDALHKAPAVAPTAAAPPQLVGVRALEVPPAVPNSHSVDVERRRAAIGRRSLANVASVTGRSIAVLREGNPHLVQYSDTDVVPGHLTIYVERDDDGVEAALTTVRQGPHHHGRHHHPRAVAAPSESPPPTSTSETEYYYEVRGHSGSRPGSRSRRAHSSRAKHRTSEGAGIGSLRDASPAPLVPPPPPGPEPPVPVHPSAVGSRWVVANGVDSVAALCHKYEVAHRDFIALNPHLSEYVEWRSAPPSGTRVFVRAAASS